MINLRRLLGLKPKPLKPLEWKHPRGEDGKFRKLTAEEMLAKRDRLCYERLQEAKNT